jgi:DNA replication licensing factor MCM6
MATPSDAGFMSDAPSGAAATPRPRQFQRGSSARPRAPPSESLAAPSDDEGEGFADDQVPGRVRRRNDPSTIPRVEDRIGITVQDHFENFIEEYVSCPILVA